MNNASKAPTGPDVAGDSRDGDSSPGETPPGEFSLRWLGGSIVLAGLLPAGLVFACYLQQGFVPAGRCATALVMPISLVWIGLLVVTIWNAGLGRIRSACIAFALFAAWSILGNGAFNQALISWVEAPLVADPHPEFERWTELPAGYPGRLPIDAAVTLGGSAGLVLEDFEEVYSEGERIVSAAQAYHSGMTKTIITTGTSSDGIGNPSEVGRELLV
ncbi:MAG: YdcF family protein, partial [Rhodopirellula sp. JB044]